MKLYHGSYVEIHDIDLEISLKGKDFGQGFYLSEDLNQAIAFARFRSLSTNAIPVVNVYEFDINSIPDGLTLKTFDSYSREWAEFVLNNRQNSSNHPIHNFDIVCGPIADDKVGQQIRRFIDGEISMDEFIDRIKYFKGITFQYFFGTRQALATLQKITAIYVQPN